MHFKYNNWPVEKGSVPTFRHVRWLWSHICSWHIFGKTRVHQPFGHYKCEADVRRDFSIRKGLLNIISLSIYWVLFLIIGPLTKSVWPFLAPTQRALETEGLLMSWGLHFHKRPKDKVLWPCHASGYCDLHGKAMNGHALCRPEGERNMSYHGKLGTGAAEYSQRTFTENPTEKEKHPWLSFPPLFLNA